MTRACYLLVLSLALAILIGCDALTSVRGIVSSPDGRPVAGALVRLVAVKSGKAKQMKTVEDGSFSLDIVHGAFAGHFQLVVSKPGYSTFSRDLPAKSRAEINVTLARQQNDGELHR